MFEIVRGFESFDKVDRSFSAAVDFEPLKNSLEETEQFAKDYIDCEKYNTLYTVSLKVPENPSK